MSPEKYEIFSYGKVRKLIVKKLHPIDDKGKYECKTGVMTTACDVNVRRKICLKFIISHKTFVFTAALRLERGLKDVNTVEEEEVTFEVELSKADSKGKWFKDGKVIYPDQKYFFEIFHKNNSFLFFSVRLFSMREGYVD